MRKVDEKLVDAITNRKDATFNNTKVIHWDRNVSVYLHGHMIAQRVDGRWRVSLAGYNTNTTRNRVSAIIREFCYNESFKEGAGVSTRACKVFLHDSRGKTEIDAHGWHLVEV